MLRLLRPSLDWLLVFMPVCLILRHIVHADDVWVFVTASIAIIPLAGWMGHATEHLSAKAGQGVGGLLNATFGNAAELIIALLALNRGLYDVVKASLTGSIVGNILLVLGGSFFLGGLRHSVQRFHAPAARSQATMLTLAAIAFVLPMAYHYLTVEGERHEQDLSLEISIVMLVTYALSLWFSLRTHRAWFLGLPAEKSETPAAEPHEVWSVRKALLVLLGATALVAWMSEILVGSVEHAAQSLGLTEVFVGVVVVALIGNAAEHSTAVVAAWKNKMDLSFGIAVGSSVQIAMFVAPVLVLVSHFMHPAGMPPMTLVFTPAEALALGLAILIVEQIASDGESNWLEGVQLLSVYLILAIIFYYLPGTR